MPADSALRQRLKVEAVTTELVQRTLVTPATVEAEPSRLAKISPPLAGRLVKLFVQFGDTVSPATALFSLSSSELVTAQSEYLKAQSSLAQAQRNVLRQKDLLEHGIAAQRDLELAQTERDIAQSELGRAGLRLKLLGLEPGNLGGAVTVTSPIAGRIVDLAATSGQYLNDPATVLMTVADLSRVWITANVQERDIRRVHVGDEAAASLTAYPGEVFAGRIAFVGDLLDLDTRTIKVRVAYDNTKGLFKPGMFASVTFRSAAALELVVPTAAVVLAGDRSTVYVETSPWSFERRVVEVGQQTADRIQVLKGLAKGERVVTTNAVLLP